MPQVCGIAGFNLDQDIVQSERLNTKHLARALLLGIEERGFDATGAAWFKGDKLSWQKGPLAATKFVKALTLDPTATTAVLHTRWATHGDPKHNENNHPVIAGAAGKRVAGTHNGVVYNTWQLEYDYNLDREAKVDSEVIFAMLAQWGEPDSMWKDIHGSFAIGWLREDVPGELNVMRGTDSPLWVMETEFGVVYASTKHALEAATVLVGEPLLGYMEVEEGRILHAKGGYITSTRNVEVDDRWSYGYSSTRVVNIPNRTNTTNTTPYLNAYMKEDRRTYLGSSAIERAKMVGLGKELGARVDSAYGYYHRIGDQAVDFHPWKSLDLVDAVMDELSWLISSYEGKKEATPEVLKEELARVRVAYSRRSEHQQDRNGIVTDWKEDSSTAEERWDLYVEDGKVFSFDTGDVVDPYTLPLDIQVDGRRYSRNEKGEYESSALVLPTTTGEATDYLLWGNTVYAKDETGAYYPTDVSTLDPRVQAFDDSDVEESVIRTLESMGSAE